MMLSIYIALGLGLLICYFVFTGVGGDPHVDKASQALIRGCMTAIIILFIIVGVLVYLL